MNLAFTSDIVLPSCSTVAAYVAKVTAVLVEGALANAANDKELSRHDMKQTAANPCL